MSILQTAKWQWLRHLVKGTGAEKQLNPGPSLQIPELVLFHSAKKAKETKGLMHGAQTGESRSTKLPAQDEEPSYSSTCLRLPWLPLQFPGRKFLKFTVYPKFSSQQVGRFMSAISVMTKQLLSIQQVELACESHWL